MRIDEEGNMELSAEENQRLMDQLEIAPEDYEDPPVEIECVSMDDQAATFTALNTNTGKTIELVFDLMAD
ncbi:MAG: hypothetical protein EBT06_03450 [Gammaproteobacteria bacterium]|jgi:hypothetical protein|nr:hypothetical protein [Gammaproteobacteria bacterium]NBT43975.1 hypothetical protein [Gammaproteobacteria bacterium]NBY22912.1 hypothetical protein [Gammaproteobacteria bacterium]NDE34204.1 hypothetical protein [Gammaproteobacteria bacterium]NDE56181.1 hypothetical protein [Gammaproteobacteria bacterium]